MSKWRRPATKVYDYNHRLGEHYYKPQLDYMENRKGRAKTPPTAKTFAERFAEDPIYGNYSGPSLRRSGLGGDSYGEKFGGSVDDIGLGGAGSSNNRRQQLLADLDSMRGPSSPRLVVGDRLLDSVGIQESKLSQPLALTSSLSSSKYQSSAAEGMEQSASTSSRRRMVGFAQSAGADVMSEDPFKSRISSKFDAAKKKADEMMQDMQKDSESSVSRFRAKVQARKEEQMNMNRRDQVSNNFGFTDDDEETAAIQSRVNKIGERARARLAQLDDDFPDIQIGSSLASRRAGNAVSSYADDEDDSRVASRTLKISKRSIKASYDME